VLVISVGAALCVGIRVGKGVGGFDKLLAVGVITGVIVVAPLVGVCVGALVASVVDETSSL
jgi:putative Mn2+ efflux pump MntP